MRPGLRCPDAASCFATLAVPAALVALLAITPAAAASVPPSPAQLAELEAAALHNNDFHVSGEEVELSEARISTADPSWAAADVTYPGLHRRRTLLFTSPPTEGLAIFWRDSTGSWVMRQAPSNECGVGSSLSVPIAVQYDLALPNCGLAGATLGEEVLVRDADGGFKVEPRSLFFVFPRARVRIVHLLRWKRWPVNRGAEAEAYGRSRRQRCAAACGRGRTAHLLVGVALRGYTHCDGRLVFRRIEWGAIFTGADERHHSFELPCDG